MEFELALRESEKAGRRRPPLLLDRARNQQPPGSRHEPPLPGRADPARSARNCRMPPSTFNRPTSQVQRIKLITARSLRFYKQSNSPERGPPRRSFSTPPWTSTAREASATTTSRSSSRQRSTEPHQLPRQRDPPGRQQSSSANAIDATMGTDAWSPPRPHPGRERTGRSGRKRASLLTIADTGRWHVPRDASPTCTKPSTPPRAQPETASACGSALKSSARHHGRLTVRSRAEPSAQAEPSFRLFLPVRRSIGRG